MATLVLPDNGQTAELPDHIARDDNQLKAALAIFMPGASNIEISREEKDGQLTVKVVKKAGTKGNEALEALICAPETRNPAVNLYQNLEKVEKEGILDPAKIALIETQLEEVARVGEAEAKQINRALGIIEGAPAIAAKFVPEGF